MEKEIKDIIKRKARCLLRTLTTNDVVVSGTSDLVADYVYVALDNKGYLIKDPSFQSTASPLEVAKMHTRMNTLEQKEKVSESKIIDLESRNLDLQHCIGDQFREITALNVSMQKQKEWKTKKQNKIAELEAKLESQYEDFVNSILQLCEDSYKKTERPEPCCDTCSGLLWDNIRSCYFCDTINSHRFSAIVLPSDHCPQCQKKD